MSRSAAKPHSGRERWLVSYADFITLMFAFFVVLYASAEMDRKKVVRLSAAIEGGFQQLGAFARNPPVGPHSAHVPVGGIPPASSLHNLPSTIEAGPGGVADADALQRELESALGEEIRQHEIEMRNTPEGLVLSLREVGFFDSGRAEMVPAALPKLGKIASILNSHGFDIRVEGNTDDVPIHNSEFHSNWELSTARATQVVTLLVENYGLDPLRVSAAGYGPYRPVASNDSAQGRKLNRRVDLVITSGGPGRSASTVPVAQSPKQLQGVDKSLADLNGRPGG
jgi:chemotaxis protein MotB